MKVSFILVTLIAVITSCAIRRSEPVKGRNFVPANAEVAKGEQVFMSYCHKCHPAGESGLAPSINSSPAPSFLKRFQVRHGLGVMPSFKSEVLSKQDLDHLITYIKAWKKY